MLKLEKFPFEGGIDKEFEFMQVELKGFFIKDFLSLSAAFISAYISRPTPGPRSLPALRPTI